MPVDENDLTKMIIDSMGSENKSHIQLPERDKLLMYLHSLMLITGRTDIMFCNAFLDEAIQLLINSIFLYEDGLFDCAFYSVRQAGEVVDSMLYLSQNGNETLEEWSEKEYFPMDGKVKKQLEKLSNDYKEVKSLIPDYFKHYDELIKKAHKIIHKQGFDAFYRLRNMVPDRYGFLQKDETEFFVQCLKYTIGKVLIIFIILEPLSLALSDALSDEKVSLKMHFNPMTEPIDVDYFKDYLGLDDIIAKIKCSKFYKDFTSYFAKQEPMSPAVFSVVREEAWDISALDEIGKQLYMLNSYEIFMFSILKCGIRITHFYFNEGLSWYFTSIKSNFDRHTYGRSEFEKYLKPDNRFNQPCENIFMSVVVMYDEPLFMEHNAILTNEEIQILKVLEAQGIQKNKELIRAVDDQFKSFSHDEPSDSQISQ